MILSGEKKEEYRAITPYWHKRLYKKGYDTITFSNGYAKDRPQFIIELIDIQENEGREEWGAITGVTYYVLRLGRILK